MAPIAYVPIAQNPSPYAWAAVMVRSELPVGYQLINGFPIRKNLLDLISPLPLACDAWIHSWR
jgi:hypothetical protein